MKTVSERFWAKVAIAGLNDCWLWTGSASRGYGHITVNGRGRKATHISLELDGRPRRDGQLALHSCDNPLCVNPRHLRWGTYFENTEDKLSRNRARCGIGETHGRAKLTADHVRQIRNAEPKYGVFVALQRKFGVGRSTIDKIRRRETWRHV